jgi:hypothetical protein
MTYRQAQARLHIGQRSEVGRVPRLAAVDIDLDRFAVRVGEGDVLVSWVSRPATVNGTAGAVAALMAVIPTVSFNAACSPKSWSSATLLPATGVKLFPAGSMLLGTGQRNIAAALVVASQSFNDPNVVVMVTVVAIVGLIILMPLSRALANRGVAQHN